MVLVAEACGGTPSAIERSVFAGAASVYLLAVSFLPEITANVRVIVYPAGEQLGQPALLDGVLNSSKTSACTALQELLNAYSRATARWAEWALRCGHLTQAELDAAFDDFWEKVAEEMERCLQRSRDVTVRRKVLRLSVRTTFVNAVVGLVRTVMIDAELAAEFEAYVADGDNAEILRATGDTCRFCKLPLDGGTFAGLEAGGCGGCHQLCCQNGDACNTVASWENEFVRFVHYADYRVLVEWTSGPEYAWIVDVSSWGEWATAAQAVFDVEVAARVNVCVSLARVALETRVSVWGWGKPHLFYVGNVTQRIGTGRNTVVTVQLDGSCEEYPFPPLNVRVIDGINNDSD